MTMKAIIEKIVKIRPTPYGFIGKDDTGIINKTVVIKLFTIPIYKKEITRCSLRSKQKKSLSKPNGQTATTPTAVDI